MALSHNIPEGGQDVTRTIASAHGLTVKKAESLKKEHGFSTTEKSGYTTATIELVFSRIFGETKRVLQQYETSHNKSVSGIILTGGGGVTKELATYAQSIFSITVTIADPFAKTQAPAFMRPVLNEIGPEFAVAVGLALRKVQELG